MRCIRTRLIILVTCSMSLLVVGLDAPGLVVAGHGYLTTRGWALETARRTAERLAEPELASLEPAPDRPDRCADGFRPVTGSIRQ